MLYPSDFKINARKSLRGKWLTALLVALVAMLPMTVNSLANDWLKMCKEAAEQQALQHGLLQWDVSAQVPAEYWILAGAATLVNLLLSPVLLLGMENYFLRLTYGDDLGFKGLTSRMRSFGKALWLAIRIGVPTLLGMQLLVVPGLILAANYSMACFFLAEEPEISVEEAIRRSKKAVYGYRLTYMWTALSIALWMVLPATLEYFLGDFFAVPVFLFGQIIGVFIDTYKTSADAWFYRMVSERGGAERVLAERLERMAAKGASQTQLHVEKEKTEKYLKDIRKFRAAKSYYDD